MTHRTIPLSGGGVTLVDEADYPFLSWWCWKLHGQGYACRTSWDAGTRKWLCVLMHRVIATPPPDMQVDHINRNRLDNRRANLRVVDQSTNCFNQTVSSRNTAGHRGGTWDASRKKWQVRVKYGGRNLGLGRFTSLDEAVQARAVFDDAHGTGPQQVPAVTPPAARDLIAAVVEAITGEPLEVA